MNATPPPSGCLRVGALIVATIAGVIVVIGLWGVRYTSLSGPVADGSLWRSVELLLLIILVGSCIAIPCCLMIGLPLWHFAILSGRQRRRDARRFGLMTGALIGIGMAVLGEPWISGPDEALDLLGYCLAGLCAGSIAHRVAYPP